MQVYLTLVRRLSSGSDWQFLRPPVQMSPRSDPARFQVTGRLGTVLGADLPQRSRGRGNVSLHRYVTLVVV